MKGNVIICDWCLGFLKILIFDFYWIEEDCGLILVWLLYMERCWYKCGEGESLNYKVDWIFFYWVKMILLVI